MIGLAVATMLAAAPTADSKTRSRIFIAGGAKTQAEAQKLERAMVVPNELKLSAGFPKLVDSKTIEGLNPGFFVIVLGVCGDTTAAETGHSNGLAALVQRRLKGAYAKQVASRTLSCPLWIEPSEKEPKALPGLLAKPDDTGLLLAVAKEQHAGGSILGASILLRRALALGASDDETLALSRTVEFVLEDAPFRLPP